jgi:iron-sulfur cluster assembly protein
LRNAESWPTPVSNRKESIVLTLTDNAAMVVKTLTVQGTDSTNGGVRISGSEADDTGLKVAVTPEPEPADQVLETDGARVFVEETAAVVLDDKLLDAQVDQDGAVHFALSAVS